MDLFRRNFPILLIGTVILMIFLAIIAAGQGASPNRPNLQEVDESALIAAHTYTRGSPEAPVTLVEFSDFQCSACRVYHPIVSSLYKRYPDHVRIAFRHFPLPQNQYAKKAGEAAQIAGEEGKFWDYIDIMFENNIDLAIPDLVRYAEILGMDKSDFEKRLKSGNYSSLINEDLKAGRNLGINATPTFFLNGRIMTFNTPEEFESQLNAELSKFLPMNTQPVEPEIDKNNINYERDPSAPRITYDPKDPASTLYKEVDEKYGLLEISYTDSGFKPKTSNGWFGQLLKIKNESSGSMVLTQIEYKFDEVGSQKVIGTGETFEFRIMKKYLWTFKERTSGNTGSVYIY